VQDISAEQTQNVCRLFEGDDTTAADMGEVPSGGVLAAALHAAWSHEGADGAAMRLSGAAAADGGEVPSGIALAAALHAARSCQEMVDVDCADGAAATAMGGLQQAQAQQQQQQQQNPYPWWQQQQSQYPPVGEQFVAAPGSAAGYCRSSAEYGDWAEQHSSSAVQQPQTQQKKTLRLRSRLGTASSVGASGSGSSALRKKAAAGSRQATPKATAKPQSRTPKRRTATTATPPPATTHPAAAAAASRSAVCAAAAAALTSTPAPCELATQSTKDLQQQQQQNGPCVRVRVVCGQVPGVYDSSKHMVQLQDGSWVTPTTLEQLGGLGRTKKWRQSVWVAGGPEGGEEEGQVPLGKWLEVRGLGSLAKKNQQQLQQPPPAAVSRCTGQQSVSSSSSALSVDTSLHLPSPPSTAAVAFNPAVQPGWQQQATVAAAAVAGDPAAVQSRMRLRLSLKGRQTGDRVAVPEARASGASSRLLLLMKLFNSRLFIAAQQYHAEARGTSRWAGQAWKAAFSNSSCVHQLSVSSAGIKLLLPLGKCKQGSFPPIP
jgi:hypothetical protein